MRETKKILVTGHPRSGTGYMSQLLKLYGFDVGHEIMGRDGISAWTFANPTSTQIPTWTGDTSVPADYQFEHTIHVVRNPVDCVSSVIYTENTKPRSLLYRMRYVRTKYFDIFKMNDIELAVASYCVWNQMIQATKPDLTTKLSTAPKMLHQYLVENKLVGEDSEIQVLHKVINSRPHPKHTYNEITSKIKDKKLMKVWKNVCEWYRSL